MNTSHKNIVYEEGCNVQSKDLDALFHAIGWRARGAKKWDEVLSKSFYVYTAWNGNTLIGMGRIMEDGIMCMFYDICVHPNYQRRGIGTKILKKLIFKVKDKNYSSIGLFAWEQNPGTLPFYLNQGFILKKSGMELEKYMKRE